MDYRLADVEHIDTVAGQQSADTRRDPRLVLAGECNEEDFVQAAFQGGFCALFYPLSTGGKSAANLAPVIDTLCLSYQPEQ